MKFNLKKIAGKAAEAVGKAIKKKAKNIVDEQVKEIKWAAESLDPPDPDDLLKAAENAVESTPNYFWDKINPFKKIKKK